MRKNESHQGHHITTLIIMKDNGGRAGSVGIMTETSVCARRSVNRSGLPGLYAPTFPYIIGSCRQVCYCSYIAGEAEKTALEENAPGDTNNLGHAQRQGKFGVGRMCACMYGLDGM